MRSGWRKVRPHVFHSPLAPRAGWGDSKQGSSVHPPLLHIHFPHTVTLASLEGQREIWFDGRYVGEQPRDCPRTSQAPSSATNESMPEKGPISTTSFIPEVNFCTSYFSVLGVVTGEAEMRPTLPARACPPRAGVMHLDAFRGPSWSSVGLGALRCTSWFTKERTPIDSLER